MSWNLRDKNGKFRSRRAFKQDCAQVSEEPWEVAYQKKKNKKEKITVKEWRV
jgi:hypothetical protein